MVGGGGRLPSPARTMTRAPLLSCLFAWCALLHGQETAPLNGPKDKGGIPIAFVHATVHPAPGEVLRDATVLIVDERIVAVGARVDVPKGAVVHDLKGAHLWPGLIDPYGDLGMPKGGRGAARDTLQRGARYWNPAIHPTAAAAELFAPDEQRAAELRAQGFTTVVTHRMDGIARGTSCAVQLAGRNAVEDILQPATAAHFSFRKGSSPEEYPTSLMGAIALLRQTLYDARWYADRGRSVQSDAELEALNAQLSLPLVFEASGRNDVLRIASLAREFGLAPIVKGTGDEYARLADILATRMPLIVPLALPDVYDVEDPFAALEVPLADMKHWELAPTNAARIHEAGGTFAFTTQGLKETGALWTNLRRMLRCGLDSTTAIAALTTAPAALFHLDDHIGTIAPGKRADLVISSNHLLDTRNVVLETWVAGRRHVQKAMPPEDPRGTFDLNLRSTILKLKVTGEPDKPEAEVGMPANDSLRVKADLTVERTALTLVFDGRRLGFPGPVRLNGTIHERGTIWDGQGQLPGGDWFAWSAVRQQGPSPRKEKKERNDALDSLWSAPTGTVWYPLGAYGRPLLPDTGTVIFRNATVWTNGPLGTIPRADVAIHGGRIVGVGQGLDPVLLFPGRRRPSVLEIDAAGRHLTCGIIDEHAHIAIARGVNESGHAITAEVRIGDVTDPDDVDIYRNLAGGVTAVQQLHGSANPIGGQSALTKLRWGQLAERMHIGWADGFIKFALGENVKQSNWHADGSRFPQTRMGVEQIMYDAFHRAREYRAEWNGFATASAKPPAARQRRGAKPEPPSLKGAPRRDLELEALAEILEMKRFISCHSYVQSEIAMLMDVADSMGFTVQTFTHVLEGYKVAQRLKEHGATASTFSDWWAYKMEVGDAIPHNAALLDGMGVNTCINSDDAEMARRLNQEAAKAVKYGGATPEAAWRMVTLNPAKALRLDARMGSVEVGKDADLVLWSTDPLSIDAKVELTFVDGVRCFDRAEDARLREAMRAERERLVTKMIAARKAGAPARKAERREKRHWECETIGEEP